MYAWHKFVSVVVVGPSRSQELSKTIVVSSYLGEMTLGRVTVEVTDGIVTRIFGNEISSYCSLDSHDLEQVRDELVTGSRNPSHRVTISGE